MATNLIPCRWKASHIGLYKVTKDTMVAW